MGDEGSVSAWLDRLKAGDRAGTGRLWERYFERLVRVARARLQGAPRRAADEEDVALSAFHSFCRAAEKGRLPRLLDRDSLWRLLVVITSRKAAHLARDEGRLKRRPPAEKEADLETLLASEPTPEFAAQLADEIQRLLDALDSPELAQVALWKMEGYSNDEIAVKLDCVPRTVERRLVLIRRIWTEI
jgi:RNA polymerase sigma factor (sigma-70 family)